MSKVHEALKRAQEERSLSTQQGESDNGVHERDSAPPGSSAVRSLAVQQVESANGSHNGTGPRGIVTPGPASAEFPSGLATETAQTYPPPGTERRLHTPVIGRDPKTGQFLRFEDLLRTCAKPAWTLDPGAIVFCESNREVSGSEQFRTLRSRLYHLRETFPLKKVLITSAVAGEGKTFVATNLAQAIARERDRRVLLIDADMRSPALHLPLGAPLSPGLADYLCDQATDADIIQHGQEGKLCFIAAGRVGKNPSELLSNGGLERLLERVSPLFDWVIVDSPPCLPVADANVVAGFCDGILIVVKARSTPSAAIERARKELQKRKVFGVVMNAVEKADSYAGYDAYDNSGLRDGTKRPQN